MASGGMFYYCSAMPYERVILGPRYALRPAGDGRHRGRVSRLPQARARSHAQAPRPLRALRAHDPDLPQNAVPAVRQRGRDRVEHRAGGTAVSRAMNCTAWASAAQWPTVRRRECGAQRWQRWKGSRGTATGPVAVERRAEHQLPGSAPPARAAPASRRGPRRCTRPLMPPLWREAPTKGASTKKGVWGCVRPGRW
jgi:hypothetical protein